MRPSTCDVRLMPAILWGLVGWIQNTSSSCSYGTNEMRPHWQALTVHRRRRRCGSMLAVRPHRGVFGLRPAAADAACEQPPQLPHVERLVDVGAHMDGHEEAEEKLVFLKQGPG
jgi:hypothetical protein